MPTKSILPLTILCLLMLAVLACASKGSNVDETAQTGERGLEVEESNETGVAVFPQLGSGRVNSVAFSPDGKYIVTGSHSIYAPNNTSNSNTIKLWDVITGREIRAFTGHLDAVNAVVFSPNGKYIASGSSDNTVKLWDVASGREIRTFSNYSEDDSEQVNAVVFSPDGQYIASGFSDKTVKLWNVVTGREIRTFSGHSDSVSAVVFSPDGKYIASGSQDKTIKLWNVASGRVIKTFLGHTGNVDYDNFGDVCSIAFSPDGKRIVSGSTDETIKLWNVSSSRAIRTLHEQSEVYSVSFSPDGKYIASGSFFNWEGELRIATVKLWDAFTGKRINSFKEISSGILSVMFSPDGQSIVYSVEDTEETGHIPIVKMRDITSGRELTTFRSYANRTDAMTISADGKYIATGSFNNVKLWDRISGMPIMTFSGFNESVRSIAFSPDGKYIVALTNNTVKLWDVADGREIKNFEYKNAYFSSVAYSPDGKYIAYDGGNTLILRNVDSGERKNFTGHTRSIHSVVFSPDGKHIISGSFDGTMKLWDITSGKEIRTFQHSEVAFYLGIVYDSIAISPDGNYIASSNRTHSNNTYNNTVKLWDVTNGREIRDFSGHSDTISSVAFSSNGKYIVSGSRDKTIKLWNVVTGEEVRTFNGDGGINSVAFTPDGTQIISGSHNTTRLWDVATGKEIAQFISFSGEDSQLASATRALTVTAKTAATSNEGEWLSITPDGFYQASPRGDRYLNVRVGNTVSGIDSYRSTFYNPDVVQARLQGRPDPVSKGKVTIQQAANFTPPIVTIQSPTNFSTTNTAQANLSVNIIDKNQPIQNIKILVNGRLIGRNELAAIKGQGLQAQKASLTVTGNLKTVNFDLPITLDPGRNIIEVVAYNGYSESPRLPVEVTWNAPANQRPTLPNLWILAVGVNNYQDANIKNLNYCVSDAKGVIDSLKAQEGKRYGKVNSLLIADGEAVTPTTANIKQNLKFIDQAGERDVVLLFLAGHGTSENGKFLFLPGDVRLNADNTVHEATTISDGDIVNVLDRAGNLLVFIDACQSGGVDNDRLVRSLMDTNAFVFTSSRGNELSQERKELGHGVFTYSIMEGLKGAVEALAQGNVTVLSLSGFVSNDVPKRTNGAQNPKAYSLGFYDFPLAVTK